MTLPPSRVSSPRRRIAGPAPPSSGGSDVEMAEDDREDSIGDDDQKNRFDDRSRREPADALGAARDAQPLVAADQRDDAGEGRCLQHAYPEAPARQGRAELAQEARNGDVEGRPTHDRAAEQAHYVG